MKMESLLTLSQIPFIPMSLPWLLIWHVLPAAIYFYFTKGLPNQKIWLVVVLVLGWIGLIIALLFGPKPKRRM